MFQRDQLKKQIKQKKECEKELKNLKEGGNLKECKKLNKYFKNLEYQLTNDIIDYDVYIGKYYLAIVKYLRMDKSVMEDENFTCHAQEIEDNIKNAIKEEKELINQIFDLSVLIYDGSKNL